MKPGLRVGARRLGFGLSTVLGLRRLGFFVPYRFAGTVRSQPYPALEPLFRAAEPGFHKVVDLLESFGADIRRILRGKGPARFDQDWFPRLDAAAAYVLVRHERPRRIIEIGSGHSTRFLARAAQDCGLEVEIVAIDPAPRASLASLGVRHEPALLSDADPTLFAALEPGDMLFIDSSHVAMPGTDVDRIVGDVLPRLPSGVLVQFHDVLLPDPYPAEWAWRGYNEGTVVAALMGGGCYDLVFSSHWVASRHPEWLASGIISQIPLVAGARETSLWLRKR